MWTVRRARLGLRAWENDARADATANVLCATSAAARTFAQDAGAMRETYAPGEIPPPVLAGKTTQWVGAAHVGARTKRPPREQIRSPNHRSSIAELQEQVRPDVAPKRAHDGAEERAATDHHVGRPRGPGAILALNRAASPSTSADDEAGRIPLNHQ